MANIPFSPSRFAQAPKNITRPACRSAEWKVKLSKFPRRFCCRTLFSCPYYYPPGNESTSPTSNPALCLSRWFSELPQHGVPKKDSAGLPPFIRIPPYGGSPTIRPTNHQTIRWAQHKTSWRLFSQPFQKKDAQVKFLDHFPNFRGEHKSIFEFTTTKNRGVELHPKPFKNPPKSLGRTKKSSASCVSTIEANVLGFLDPKVVFESCFVENKWWEKPP